MTSLLRIAALSLLTLCWALPAGAVNPDEILEDPVLESRARELSAGIRCLVCQNESIDSSNADLARDLRVLVRERLLAGDSDQQVKDYLVARYGDFVLLSPPVRPGTYLLWFGPAIILLLGIGGVLLYFRRLRSEPVTAAAAGLSESERARLAALLQEPGNGGTGDRSAS